MEEWLPPGPLAESRTGRYRSCYDYSMQNNMPNSELTEALHNVASLGAPILLLVDKIDKLIKKIDELIEAQRNDRR
jgi:hypothetical protein